jgi:hypothetical protein
MVGRKRTKTDQTTETLAPLLVGIDIDMRRAHTDRHRSSHVDVDQSVILYYSLASQINKRLDSNFIYKRVYFHLPNTL